MAAEDYRPKARLPRGFRDRTAAELAAERAMLERIRASFEGYGFEALETPAFEYTDALGKFLPDQDRPNEGVFSLQDDDEQWLSLRYDLTAPLARYVAENYQNLPKPFRRYQTGRVWRNEKPGPGRFREFTQFDADTVGSAAPTADAELLMLLADTYEALGLSRGDYVVKLNSRKLLDGVLEIASVDPIQRGTVLRAIDKFDRLGIAGVTALLGSGRKDESGDVTKGAGLTRSQIAQIIPFIAPNQVDEPSGDIMTSVAGLLKDSAVGIEGVRDLGAILNVIQACGYGDDRIRIDTGIVRGLDYYTGPVFEGQLTFPVTNEAGEEVVMGSIGGGGRYDDLVARFTGQKVPATGVSIGVSRLLAALRARGSATKAEPLIVVLVLDKKEAAASFALARDLRAAGLRAEAYAGDSGMKAQLKYADRRDAAVAVIEGGDERARGEVTLKDLALGAELAKATESRAEWTQGQPAQTSVPRDKIVESIRAMLGENPLMGSFPNYNPQRLAALDAQASAMLRVFTQRDYARVEPAILQPAEVFLDRSGEEIRRRTFVLTDPGGRELCLRPDLTIPVCRMFLEGGAKVPARLAYHGPAFRYQPNEPERPAQFLQTGIECLGEKKSDDADIEVLSLAVEALRAAGLEDFSVQIGDVALFAGLIDALDVPPLWRGRLKRHFWRPAYFRELLARLSGNGPKPTQAYLAHLGTLDETEARAALEGLLDYLGATADKPAGGRTRDEIVDRLLEQAAEAAAVRLDPRAVALIDRVLSVAGTARPSLVEIRKLLKGAKLDIDAPLEAMERRLAALEKLGLDQKSMRFAARFGRNMEYYTGFVFELWARDAEGPVQIAGGGRYDTLLRILGAKHEIPAVGCAIRSERVLAARNASGSATSRRRRK